jgi:cobalt-zinc-cadmium efflux system membrane fusion protein
MTRSRFRPAIRHRRSLLAGLTVLLLLAGYGLRHHLQPAMPTVEAKPKSHSNHLSLAAASAQLSFLRIESVQLLPLPASETFNARISLAEDLTARIFPPVAGRVIRLLVGLGDKVKAGQPLAVIDAPEFGQAIADLHKAEADAALKDKALARAQTLYAGEALARRDLEAAEADSQARRAEAERARLRLANLTPAAGKLQGEQLTLRAPLAGIIVDRQANPGTEVRPDSSTPLFIIGDLDRLWLNIDLPEKAAAQAQPGREVHFSVEAFPGMDFNARIERVGAMVDPSTRRIPVRAGLDNRDRRLKPEMYARATISQGDGQQAIRLPVSALLTGGLNTHVFIQTADREFDRIAVNVLRQDAEFAYIAAGTALNPGDRVVVRGALLLASEMAQGD